MVGQSNLDEDPNGNPVDPTRYRGMVGSLMYLTASRPDLVFVVCMCAQYPANPTKKHLTAVKRVAKIQGKLTDYRFDYNKIPFHSDSQSAIALSCNSMQHFMTKHIVVRYHFIKEQVKNEVVELYIVKTDYQLADILTKALVREHFEFLINRLECDMNSMITVGMLIILLALRFCCALLSYLNAGTSTRKDEVQNLESKFWNHQMVGNDIEKYIVRFNELARMVPTWSPQRRIGLTDTYGA
ncbi:hypothetical protein Tco_0180126 [Tanacetum coccineum]